jgi:hypothetical protein
MITRHDKILTGMIVGTALVAFFFFSPFVDKPGNKVVIEAAGEVVQVIPLAEIQAGQQVPIQGPLGDSTLEMGENKVRLIHSPCPDLICVHMGWISKPGEMIICIPNRVVVRIEGEPEWDGIAR